MNACFPSLKALVKHLLLEDDPNFVYRGQIRDYTGPLLPSLYRGLVMPKQIKLIEMQTRLRGKGSVFHELPFVEDKGSEKSRRISVGEYLRHLFGFPISQLLLQQYGIYSEGVDVTKDVNVAAVFASTYKRYDEPGIIFRFKVNCASILPKDIFHVNFYNCPWFIDAMDTLRVFPNCDSWQESLDSFKRYCGEYSLRCNAGFSRKRPLDILKFPWEMAANCRVARQHAGLIFPDMVLSARYNELNCSPPEGKTANRPHNLVEDLRYCAGIECFQFTHHTDEQDMLPYGIADLFPDEDLFYDLLTAFLDDEKSIGQLAFDTEQYVVRNRHGTDFLYKG